MKRARAQLGISQPELAEAADLSVQFIAALEQGERSATLATLDKIADAFGIPLSQLFALGEQPDEGRGGRGRGAKRGRKPAAADQLALLVEGLTPEQQERVVEAVRAMRGLVRTKKRK